MIEPLLLTQPVSSPGKVSGRVNGLITGVEALILTILCHGAYLGPSAQNLYFFFFNVKDCFMHYIYIFLHLFYVCATAQVWKSEDDVVLPFHQVSQGR